MTVHIDPSWNSRHRRRPVRSRTLETVRNWAAWVLAGSFIAWLVTR